MVVVAIILLTAGLFGYINRLGVDFGKTVLVLAVSYDMLIGVVKTQAGAGCAARSQSEAGVRHIRGRSEQHVILPRG